MSRCRDKQISQQKRKAYKSVQTRTSESLDATTLKCMPPPLKCTWSRCDLDLCRLILKTFSAMPITWRIFVSSSIVHKVQIYHVHAKYVLTNGRPAGRPEHMMPLAVYCWRPKHKNAENAESWAGCITVTSNRHFAKAKQSKWGFRRWRRP